MMKKILLPVICLVFCQFANAQKSLLSLDEQNKYIYYQVVELAGVSADTLGTRAADFVKESFPKLKPSQSGDTSIWVKDKFLTYSSIAFAKHEIGEISYELNIQCKNGKHRFWLTDFLFTPYKKNRYGVFVPENGIEIPLEKCGQKLDKGELQGVLDQTGAFCQQLGDKLKYYMAHEHHVQKPVPKTGQVKKVVTDKW